MTTKFQFYEVVRVIAVSPRMRESFINKEGFVVGMSEPDAANKRDYAVHINEYMTTFAFPEDLLESCGRIGMKEEIVTRTEAFLMGMAVGRAALRLRRRGGSATRVDPRSPARWGLPSAAGSARGKGGKCACERPSPRQRYPRRPR
jgi:hypothetical protein